MTGQRTPNPGPNPTAALRPMLKPGLRRVWRDPETVQFGVDPQTAVVVPGVDDQVEAFLLSLDGRRTRAEVLAACLLPPDQATALLDHLTSAGVLDDAAAVSAPLARTLRARRERLHPELAALVLQQTAPGDAARAFQTRRRSTVRIEGLGRLGAVLALLLDASGFDRVELVDGRPVRQVDVHPGGHRSVDVDQPRDRALQDRLGHDRLRGTARRTPGRGRADLVVLAGLDHVRGRAQALTAAGQPHLLLDVVEDVGRLGPLVVPGATACLTCLDHHRTDRDRAWPRILAQLTGAAGDHSSAVTVAATAAAATWHITSWLAGGRPPSIDAELTVRPPHGLTQQHPYQPHPACGCGWQQSATA
ncbi:MAG: TOMM precursor leader peptide-binding protein [Actinomycetes bacterium]